MTSTLENVCSDVLRKVTPSQREKKEVLALAEELKERVAKVAKKARVNVKVRIEGSVAKDTWLGGEPDIDLFMQVPTSMQREAFGTICLDIARKATKGFRQVERFAEHPYLEAYVNAIRVNVVPCYRVERGEWISATDRTPFHTDYANSQLDEYLRGEIRLLKKFMKGIGAYGAEIKVGGFSGYLCELLVLDCRSFLEVLNSFAEWKERKLIDYKGYYKGRKHEALKIFAGPLVVVDPVDKGRNVASALRRKCLDELVAASRIFLQEPDKKFFYPPETRPFNLKELKEILKTRGSTLIFIKFGRIKAVPDVLWGQLYKSQRSLRKMLQLHDFEVIRDAVWSNEQDVNVLLFEVEHRFLSSLKRHLGPPIEKREDCEKFLQKHVESPKTISGPYVEKGRWIVEVRRKQSDAASLFAETLKDGGRHVGVADLVSQSIAQTLETSANEEILELCARNIGFQSFLTRYLIGRPYWL